MKKEEFLEKLKAFKENWLMNEKNNALFNNLTSTDADEKNVHK